MTGRRDARSRCSAQMELEDTTREGTIRKPGRRSEEEDHSENFDVSRCLVAWRYRRYAANSGIGASPRRAHICQPHRADLLPVVRELSPGRADCADVPDLLSRGEALGAIDIE